MSKKKLQIKKLGYPKWFSILFYMLTILIPIVLVFIEGLKAPTSKLGNAFKVSFVVLSLSVLIWYFVKKLIVSKILIKLLAKQVALEHDYSIDVGNPNKIKQLWYDNQRKLVVFDFISVLLYGGFIVIIITGITSMFLKIEKPLLLIILLYIIAYTLKFMVLILRRDNYEQTD